MKFLAKMKLLFKIQKPASDLVDQLENAKDEKRGWKTYGFWISIVGIGLSTAGALTGVIPAPAQFIIATVLQGFYNILRGAQAAESTSVKGPFVSTTFWTTTLTEIQKAIVHTQEGGIYAQWMPAALAAIDAVTLIISQNLSARAPDPSGVSKGLEPPVSPEIVK